MLSAFYQSTEAILKNNAPLLTQLRHLRDMVRDYLTCENFRLDCVQEMINTRDRHEPTLFYHPTLKFSFRIITWPAFYENNPHEHKTWSVTGVLHNQLDISTFHLLENPKRLQHDRALSAFTGDAGFLMPGCIHRVCNPSHQLSASIHLFNNLDINKPEENAIWYPAPRKYNLSKDMTERALMVGVQMAAKGKSERALSLLNQIYQIAPLHIKCMAIEAKGAQYVEHVTKILPASIHHSNDRLF